MQEISLQKASIPRQEVKEEDRWNVEAMYKNFSEWEKDLKYWSDANNPELKKYLSAKGKLKDGTEVIKQALDDYFLISRNLSKVYTYSHLRHDEDLADKEAKEAYEKATFAYYSFREHSSWFEPELLSLSSDDLHSILKAEALKEYKIYLEAIIRLKPHILSKEEEALLSLSSKALDGSSKIFYSFLNADLKFPSIQDSKGANHELTIGSFQKFIQSPDRTLRKNAFITMHKTFMGFENSLAEMLSSQVHVHVFEARARKYKSCLEAALYPHQIDVSVYHNLIQSVRSRLSVLHKYMSLRKKILNVETLHSYDLYVPMVKQMDVNIGYKDAEKEVIEAASFLGESYQNEVKKGLQKDRWVDRFENARKRSGAYSSGCYDSMPYILMNYHGTLRDMMTLCHETGHSMQSLLSNRHQPYQYASYPIFVAEVASTFFEEVLLRNLIKKAPSAQNKAYLINQKIDDIRATLFRQTLFAEFELLIHEHAEKGLPLTPDFLKSEYRRLLKEYYGQDLTLDEEIDIEWARIPHFYYNFYVYQYATGISAALSLVNRIEKEGEIAKQDYLSFLSSGSSKFPIDLLKLAGVDMTQPKAVSDTIDYFEKLTNELENLLK